MTSLISKPSSRTQRAGGLEARGNVLREYADLFTPEVLAVLEALAPLDRRRAELMQARIARRSQRSQQAERITFLAETATIGGTNIRVADARAGRFSGGDQLGRSFPALGYSARDAQDLLLLEAAPRTVRGARDLLSVALQYGNAFGQGMQAAALKPADFFGDDDVLYLMEGMATGEIRLSILWEWLHKAARFSEGDAATGVKAGERFDAALFERLLQEQYAKLLAAGDRDVHED